MSPSTLETIIQINSHCRSAMTSSVTRLVCDAYREAAKTPLLVSALLDLTSAPGLAAVSTRWAQTNLATNTKLAYSKQMLVNTAIMELMHEAAAVAETGVEMATVSGDTSIKVWGASILTSIFSLQ